MRKPSLWFAFVAIPVGVVIAVVIGLWGYVLATATPIHRHAAGRRVDRGGRAGPRDRARRGGRAEPARRLGGGRPQRPRRLGRRIRVRRSRAQDERDAG